MTFVLGSCEPRELSIRVFFFLCVILSLIAFVFLLFLLCMGTVYHYDERWNVAGVGKRRSGQWYTW
jgi:hypothetical protein